MATPIGAKLHDLTAYLRDMEREMTERARKAKREEPLVPASFPLGRAWHLVYTAPMMERRVVKDLEAQGFPVFCPHEVRQRVRRGRRIKVTHPVFPRYVFVAFDIEREEWSRPILSTDGVAYILENNLVPVRIPERVIEDLRWADAHGMFDRDKLPAVGEALRVTEGLLAGEIGKVLSAKPNNRVKLLLKIMSRSVVAEFNLAGLERTG